ncbi:hypothetical protein B0H16DRAFT_1456786 [Mycena metata]|uniref:Uncharacterized protein n=1 Tax=Mycena metata TaxID=1033252 RepID=A0AAD7JBB6_9AGAR|nr:hypothetical protein B0H16DRAFT_1456786 [Mycena metata]
MIVWIAWSMATLQPLPLMGIIGGPFRTVLTGRRVPLVRPPSPIPLPSLLAAIPLYHSLSSLYGGGLPRPLLLLPRHQASAPTPGNWVQDPDLAIMRAFSTPPQVSKTLTLAGHSSIPFAPSVNMSTLPPLTSRLSTTAGSSMAIDMVGTGYRRKQTAW